MYRVQNVFGRQVLQRTETPRRIPASAVQSQHSPLKVASAQVDALSCLRFEFDIHSDSVGGAICTYIIARGSRYILLSQDSVGAKRRGACSAMLLQNFWLTAGSKIRQESWQACKDVDPSLTKSSCSSKGGNCCKAPDYSAAEEAACQGVHETFTGQGHSGTLQSSSSLSGILQVRS